MERMVFHPFARSLLVAAFLFLAAQLGAQSSGTASSSSRHPPARTSASVPDAGGVSNGVYRNPSFGFGYKIPFGWVERTAEMREDDSGKPTDPSNAQVLLAVFERPPEVTGDSVNSAVVIAAESVKSYPGLKTAVDYFGPLEEVTKAKGFKVVNEPYEFPAGARKLAREDFSKELGKLTMQQASLVMVQRGYAVSFTFIAGSQDEVEELVERLNFAPIPAPGSSSTPNLKK